MSDVLHCLVCALASILLMEASPLINLGFHPSLTLELVFPISIHTCMSVGVPNHCLFFSIHFFVINDSYLLLTLKHNKKSIHF